MTAGCAVPAPPSRRPSHRPDRGRAREAEMIMARTLLVQWSRVDGRGRRAPYRERGGHRRDWGL